MKIKPLISSIGFVLLSLSISSNSVFAKNDKKNDKQPPSGIQKKLDRDGSLPPGWEKKLVKGQKMEQEVFKQGEIVVPINDKGEITVRVEDKVVRLYEATKEIIEVLK